MKESILPEGAFRRAVARLRDAASASRSRDSEDKGARGSRSGRLGPRYLYSHLVSGRLPPGQALFVKYAATYMAILVLPIVLTSVFYAVTARTVRDAVDRIAVEQLLASSKDMDRRLLDINRAAAQLSIDYDVNFYLNNEGPYTAIEAYDIRKISDKLASFCLGNDLLAHLLLYFSGSDYIAFEAGASPYLSFYGPLFSVEGRSAEAWRNEVLRAGGDGRRLSGFAACFADKSFDCMLSVHPIGQGDYRRGAIIGVIDAAAISRLLAVMPDDYGGWVGVYGGDGSVIAATDPDRERAVRDRAVRGSFWRDFLAGTNPGARGKAVTIKTEGGAYRLYRVRSTVSDLTYVAALDEARVLAGPRTVMWTAILILLACFVFGTTASYWFARTNSKPVDRLIRLILGESEASRGGATSAFQRVEEAIVGLEDKNRRLEGEVLLAATLARTNFLQALLHGSFRDRMRLASEAETVRVDLSGSRLVLSAGIDSAGVSGKEAVEDLNRAVDRVSMSLEKGEYAVPITPGEVAFILSSRSSGGEIDSAERARQVALALRRECSADFRGALSLGAGLHVEDPFLLTMSFAQAESSRARAARAGDLELLVYNGLTEAGDVCRYPIDLEEAVMRAVRSANVDLLRSLLEPLSRSVEGGPALGSDSGADLAAGLRGTALRLFAEFPKESAGFANRLRRSRHASPRDAVEEVTGLLADLARLREGAKRSHNTALAESVLRFIKERYGDRDLGLAMVAEKFSISENYMSNVYKEQTGECVSETIEATRIAAAKAALASTRDSLDRIADQTGYRSGASFRRAFKRVVGVSPSDYRDSLAKDS